MTSPMVAAEPEELVEPEEATEVAPIEVEAESAPLYGDKPTFTYTPKDGGELIIFPAHSTIRGEVDGVTYFEMLWEFDEFEVSSADQILTYLRRSGATQQMKRRVVRLPEEEMALFFRAWVRHDDQPLDASLPPE
jgi:hypothetical protein